MTLALSANDVYPRHDLVEEVLQLLDGSGDFTSAWHDSSGVHSLRVAVKFLDGSSPTFTIEEAQWDTDSSPRVIRYQSVPINSLIGAVDLNITARWFRVKIDAGPSDGYCAYTMRKVA